MALLDGEREGSDHDEDRDQEGRAAYGAAHGNQLDTGSGGVQEFDGAPVLAGGDLGGGALERLLDPLFQPREVGAGRGGHSESGDPAGAGGQALRLAGREEE